MAEGSSLKLIIEKGHREGETLKYSTRSSIKVGRVVSGNTIAIKDAGISSKHICIQFDNQLSKWTLSDLDSSNGTVLNGETLKPYVPSALQDGDCIKIGELTSIIVKIGADSPIRARRNPRRQGKPEAGPPVVVEKELTELGLGLGFDGDLGGNEVKEPVGKRNLRSRGKKAVDLKNDVEILSSRRELRSSKKVIPENLNIDALKITEPSVPIEPKRTRGRKKALIQPCDDLDLDEGKADIVVPSKKTRGGRKRLENAQSSGLEENLNNANESSQVEERNGAAFNKSSEDQLKNVKTSSLGENLEDGCEGIVKDTGLENGEWQDLEKMTLLDFFNYMEVQLPKEIYEKSEKIISELKEKAGKCHEFRVQRNESGKGKLVTD